MWERVNCTSSSPLRIYATLAFMNVLIFFFFLILSFLLSLLIFLSPLIYFWVREKSLINQNFMQEEIGSRLNLGGVYSHSA
jgi:hypothetical protein